MVGKEFYRRGLAAQKLTAAETVVCWWNDARMSAAIDHQATVTVNDEINMCHCQVSQGLE